MRYASAYATTARQASSRRIGRCARCHAPVLCDEEHYGIGAALVHGACGTQPLIGVAPTGGNEAATVAAHAGCPPVAPPRRDRRFVTAGGLHPARAIGTH